MKNKLIAACLLLALLSSGCAAAPAAETRLKILAAETFLADITTQVAGDRAVVDSLIPAGLDPHTFEPTPRDVARVSESGVLVINGAGVETWLEPVLRQAGGERLVITASAGIPPRTPGANELTTDAEGEVDPHFWLNPLYVVDYVDNIRAGLTQVDAAGADVYAKNAAAYSEQLRELDAWIREQIDLIPPERRLLVTNHESLGYYADHYGLTIVGAVIPSVSSEATPSARQMAALTEKIRAVGAPALFLESGANATLAEQIAAETGARVVTDLYTHSIGPGANMAATYIEMMKHDTILIVDALK